MDWNERYASDEYIYGTAPNDFLAEHAGRLSGPVLSLAEGEGRNAVYLAQRGLTVTGVDLSPVGLAKAEALARQHGVSITTVVADLATFVPPRQTFGAVISVFAHLPSSVRANLYPRVVESLLPGGYVVLEAYSERQLAHNTGGPRDSDMLMTVEKIQREFATLEPILLREIERPVQEGQYHTGIASVVQFVGRNSP